MIRRPPRSTPKPSSAASDVYKRQLLDKINKVSVYKGKKFSDHAPLVIDYDI